MPGGRSRRGGARQGIPGSTYSNRSDLNQHLPITAPSGLEYGQRGALEQSQRDAPINVPGTPSPAAPAAPAPPPAPPQFTSIHAPSQRPNEPITAGLSSGPGPGPEVLGLQRPQGISGLIASVAASSGSSDLQFLAEQARNLGQ